jgi:hypothetical protein
MSKQRLSAAVVLLLFYLTGLQVYAMCCEQPAAAASAA